jgi:hypothetical protein
MGYSPPKGRSPTCYSPVRHSHEAPKGLTPVRLACLIRAASVRSEPGSNSPSYSVASHSEEQKAHLLYSIDFSHDPHSTLSPSLPLSPFPVRKKHPPPHHKPALSRSSPRLAGTGAFHCFQRTFFPHPIRAASAKPPRRKGEYTALKYSLSSTNAKINLSWYGIVKRPLRLSLS